MSSVCSSRKMFGRIWRGLKPLIFKRFHVVLFGKKHEIWSKQHNGKVRSYLTFPRRFPILWDRLRRHLPIVSYHYLQYTIHRQMRQLHTAVVFGAYPDCVHLVAAFRAAQQLGLPFYAHMHDLWLENTQRGTAKGRLAALWEPRILRHATRVFCMTEAMQDHYEKKYGIQSELLPHCIADRDLDAAPTALRSPQRQHPTVLFVGAVSEQMNLDALKVLAQASELLPQDYVLLFCTPRVENSWHP
jgi:glycosyltransferase involved in cell wall biosynthesis